MKDIASDNFPGWEELLKYVAEFQASGQEEMEIAITPFGEMFLSDIGEGLTLQYIYFPGVIPCPGGGGLTPYSEWVRNVYSSNQVALRECANVSAMVITWFHLDPKARTIRLVDGYVSHALDGDCEEWNIYTKGFWRLVWEEIKWLEEFWGIQYLPGRAEIASFLKLRRRDFRRAVRKHISFPPLRDQRSGAAVSEKGGGSDWVSGEVEQSSYPNPLR